METLRQAKATMLLEEENDGDAKETRPSTRPSKHIAVANSDSKDEKWDGGIEDEWLGIDCATAANATVPSSVGSPSPARSPAQGNRRTSSPDKEVNLPEHPFGMLREVLDGLYVASSAAGSPPPRSREDGPLHTRATQFESELPEVEPESDKDTGMGAPAADVQSPRRDLDIDLEKQGPQATTYVEEVDQLALQVDHSLGLNAGNDLESYNGLPSPYVLQSPEVETERQSLREERRVISSLAPYAPPCHRPSQRWRHPTPPPPASPCHPAHPTPSPAANPCHPTPSTRGTVEARLQP